MLVGQTNLQEIVQLVELPLELVPYVIILQVTIGDGILARHPLLDWIRVHVLEGAERIGNFDLTSVHSFVMVDCFIARRLRVLEVISIVILFRCLTE